MKIRYLYLLSSLLCTIMFWSCKQDDPGSERPDFDRVAMLENYALHIIRPAYETLLEEANALKSRWADFSATPDEAKLLALQQQWLITALAWQSANAFNFGPAGGEGLRKGLIEEIGTFPVSREKIENYVTAGDATLNNFDRDSRGLLAIEYLLYVGGDTTADLVLDLQDDNRSAYLTALINHLLQEIDRVASDWETYQTSFIANAGTDVGSSTSQLYNEFVRSYEAAKNFKVGLPAGKRAGQNQAEPQLVEAFYSGTSRELLEAHLAAIDRIYYGKGLNGTDGIGFSEYLQAVEGGPTLITATETQWQAVHNALANVPDNNTFSGLIEQEDPSVDALHTEMQKQIRFFKSDMSSLLGIAITFNSGDGD